MYTVFLGNADHEQQPVAGCVREPNIDQLEHAFFAMKARIEKCRRPGKGGWAGLAPVGLGPGDLGRIGRGDAIGRHADGLVESSRPDVISLAGAGGVPAGCGGKGAGVDEFFSQAFFPAMVKPGPAAHHAARRDDQRNTQRDGALMRVVQGPQPQAVAVQTIAVLRAQMGPQPGRWADARRVAARKNAYLEISILAVFRHRPGAQQFDVVAQLRQGGRQRRHSLARPAMTGFKAGHDVRYSHLYRINH